MATVTNENNVVHLVIHDIKTEPNQPAQDLPRRLNLRQGSLEDGNAPDIIASCTDSKFMRDFLILPTYPEAFQPIAVSIA